MCLSPLPIVMMGMTATVYCTLQYTVCAVLSRGISTLPWEMGTLFVLKMRKWRHRAQKRPDDILVDWYRNCLIIYPTVIEHLLWAGLCVRHKTDMVAASSKFKVKNISGVHMCIHEPTSPGQGRLCSGPLWPCSLAREGKRHLFLILLKMDKFLKPELIRIAIWDN